MKTATALLGIFLFSSIGWADDNTAPIDVFCFSDDLEAGFKDKVAAAFCKEIAKTGEKKKSLSMKQSRDGALALVHFLGSGEFERRGDTTLVTGGYAWTPNETANNAAALVVVGDFTKEFTAEGTGFQAVGGVADQVEEWIRENREVILKKSTE